MNKTKIVFFVVFSCLFGALPAADAYDVAAFVWPAYQPEPRWADLGIFTAGKGEWQSVWEAKKRRPDDIWGARPIWGYTNEADPNDVAQKIDAAVASGINVFIYDWYWYEGRPFLEEALNKGFLGAPNCNRMKFYVMWANHDVNKYWDNTIDTKHGKEDTIWPAKVSDADWKTIVARWITQYFTRPNYYRIDGKPVLMIYRLDSFVAWEGLDKARKRLAYLRDEVRRAGFPGIHLQAKIRGKVPDYRSLGIDSYTLYNWNDCHWWDIVDPVTRKDPDYAACGEYALKRCDEMKAEVAEQGAAFFPNISIGWDNNARFPLSQTNRTIRAANPSDYEKYSRKIRDWAAKNIPSGLPKLITVNSWNEWTEGGYLEPDTRWGFGYLDATRKVFVEEPGRMRWRSDCVDETSATGIRPFANGERVCFFGDSITHGGTYHVDLQLYWDLRHPGSGTRLMNCGVGGDTIACGLERWAWDVLPSRPDRTFALFGGNDVGRDDYGTDNPTVDQLRHRSEHIAQYETNLVKLAARVREARQELVLMTPPTIDEYGTNYTCSSLQGCNETGLAACSAIVRKVAAREKAGMIDLYKPLTAFVRRQDRSYCFCNPVDRVHPLDDGHLILMAEILKAMGEPAEFAGLKLDAKGRGTLETTYAPKGLPFPVSDAYRKADSLYPLTESVNLEMLYVRNLPPGRYALFADGSRLGEFTDVDFVAGVNLALLPTPSARRASEAWKLSGELRFAILTLRDMVFLEKRAVSEGAKANDVADICAKLDAVVAQLKADKLPWADYYAQIVNAYHANKPREVEFRAKEDRLRRAIADLGRKPLSYVLKIEKIER